MEVASICRTACVESASLGFLMVRLLLDPLSGCKYQIARKSSTRVQMTRQNLREAVEQMVGQKDLNLRPPAPEPDVNIC